METATALLGVVMSAVAGAYQWAAAHPLIASSVVFAVVVTFVLAAPNRSRNKKQELIHELAVITEKLNEAEKIGKFGSFLWNLGDPKASYWSDEMYNLTGLMKRRTPPALDVFERIADEDDREAVRRTWSAAQREPGPFNFDMRVAVGGQFRHLRVQGKTSITDVSKPLIQGVVHDVTKEKQVDEAKSEFVSLASHQLKTPLTSIKWVAEALERSAGDLSPEQLQFVQTIRRESERMMSMINDFLNVSRLELGTLPQQWEDFEIGSLAQGVIAEQQPAADEKNIALTLTIAPSIPHVSGDKNLTHMLLQNLISNAIKYTPRGGRVSCDITKAGILRENVSIIVRDTGIGIPKDEQEHVFEKLHRASNARALVSEGTGLGLYLVKRIVDKAGGTISFSSEEGKGTTFHVLLPLSWPQERSVDTSVDE